MVRKIAEKARIQQVGCVNKAVIGYVSALGRDVAVKCGEQVFASFSHSQHVDEVDIFLR